MSTDFNFNVEELENQTTSKKASVMTTALDSLTSFGTMNLRDSYDELLPHYRKLDPDQQKAIRRTIRQTNANGFQMIKNLCSTTNADGKSVISMDLIFKAFMENRLKYTKISDNTVIITGKVKDGQYLAFRFNIQEMKAKLQEVKQVEELAKAQAEQAKAEQAKAEAEAVTAEAEATHQDSTTAEQKPEKEKKNRK